MLSVAMTNAMAKATRGGKDLSHLVPYSHRGEFTAETQESDTEAGIGAEAMEKCDLTTCSPDTEPASN